MPNSNYTEIIGNLRARASSYEAGDFTDMSPSLDREAADAIAALSRDLDARAGFVLVPEKATPGMIEAAMPYAFPSDTDDLRENTAVIWSAMVEAHVAGISRASDEKDSTQ